MEEEEEDWWIHEIHLPRPTKENKERETHTLYRRGYRRYSGGIELAKDGLCVHIQSERAKMTERERERERVVWMWGVGERK